MEKEKSLAPIESQAPQLILGRDSIKQASAISKQLVRVLETQKLYSVIEGKKFIVVEGWNTLGALLGVFPDVVGIERMPEQKVKRYMVEYSFWDKFSRAKKTATKLIAPTGYDPNQHKIIQDAEGGDLREIDEIKYKATVQLKAINGTVITKAEAICSNAEGGKLNNDEYSIASMAQTRATGKAFRLAFSWIVKMAGYEPTPAEEMTVERDEPTANGAPTPKVESKLELK